MLWLASHHLSSSWLKFCQRSHSGGDQQKNQRLWSWTLLVPPDHWDSFVDDIKPCREPVSVSFRKLSRYFWRMIYFFHSFYVWQWFWNNLIYLKFIAPPPPFWVKSYEVQHTIITYNIHMQKYSYCLVSNDYMNLCTYGWIISHN